MFSARVASRSWRRRPTRDLIRKTRAHRPHVAVVDIQMPPNHGDDGLRAAQEIRAEDPSLGIVLLSQFLEDRYAFKLLDDRPEGVGYLLKDRVADIDGFLAAVRRVARGGPAIDAEVIGRLVRRRRSGDPTDERSPREREVLALMAQGKSSRGIAKTLVVTVSAVERHVTSILTKPENTARTGRTPAGACRAARSARLSPRASAADPAGIRVRLRDVSPACG
jgi:DNA-binding NarL/FixJ family response regulator